MSNIEQFGQYPLQVNGFNNLDECLEGAMVEREIESLHPDQTITSNREVNQRNIEIVTMASFIKFVFLNRFLRLHFYFYFYNMCYLFQRWFSKLPPVLTFELSRFEFNAQLGRPEKIHKKLEFPQVMYMDR